MVLVLLQKPLPGIDAVDRCTKPRLKDSKSTCKCPAKPGQRDRLAVPRQKPQIIERSEDLGKVGPASKRGSRGPGSRFEIGSRHAFAV
jgi:hypothetical protein